MKELDKQALYNIEQVVATMAIEDMTPDRRTVENLKRIAAGEKTVDQIAGEIIEEYKNGR